MEDSLAQANDIGKVGKSTETIADQVRAGIAKSVDRTGMSAKAADRLTRGINGMAEGDVDNFARHLDNTIARNSGVTSGQSFNYNNIKGSANEIIVGREVFGVESVDKIGFSPSGLSEEADLVLDDGRVVEAKAKPSGLNSEDDLVRQLANIKSVQQNLFSGPQADEEVLFVVNNPDNIYKSGQLGESYRPKVANAVDRVDFDARFVSSSELSSTEESITKFIDF